VRQHGTGNAPDSQVVIIVHSYGLEHKPGTDKTFMREKDIHVCLTHPKYVKAIKAFFFTFSVQVLMIKVCLLKLNEMDEWDRISCQFKGRLVWQIPDKAAAHFLLPVKLKI
jgi:hypothetical protein